MVDKYRHIWFLKKIIRIFADMETKQATRIQTSLLNAAEKKALVWMAERMPKWVSSDMLSAVGFVGAVIIAVGFVLSTYNINYLWLSSFGLVVNWFGDSLDGTLARVRKHQRPIYGYYLDHMLDGINESLMFLGAGLSSLMHLSLALCILVLYLLLTINVSINAHLKHEFKLTYAKLGPTEFRLIIMIVNTLFIFIRPLREFSTDIAICGFTTTLSALDIVAVGIILILAVMFIVTMFNDLRDYDKMDPKTW